MLNGFLFTVVQTCGCPGLHTPCARIVQPNVSRGRSHSQYGRALNEPTVLIVDPALDADPGTGDGYTSSLNKTAIGFGHITLGSPTPTSLILNFAVGAPVSGLGGVNVFTSGTQNLDFQIVSGPNSTCSGASSGTTCTLEVSFLPTAPGLRNGAVVLYDTDSNPVLTLPLYGFGDAPVAVLAPNTGTVINTGGVPLPFPFQIVLDGAGNIYDANKGGNLVKISAGGGSAAVISPTGYTFSSEVSGVAIDGAGNLFISDNLNSRVIAGKSAFSFLDESNLYAQLLRQHQR